ncbi:unnamed protein product [Prorocentrum cordatum]|uniref:Uncharacterized protein n=1 Tax=Prorocentrum cordatum TaxID=2364126 RepID=A0ABN9XUB5_9DINO|nr:unnamed protein product [Polarella glacialis]
MKRRNSIASRLQSFWLTGYGRVEPGRKEPNGLDGRERKEKRRTDGRTLHVRAGPRPHEERSGGAVAPTNSGKNLQFANWEKICEFAKNMQFVNSAIREFANVCKREWNALGE